MVTMHGPRSRLPLWAGLVAAVALGGACSAGRPGETTLASSVTSAAGPVTSTAVPAATAVPSTAPERSPKTIRVPQDQPTVQAAVDAAVPGDLVLISAGTYREAVTVRTPGIVLRGLLRNGVVLDGEDALENGILVAADGVAVENLTVRRYAVNGLLFTKAYDDADPTQHTVLHGYRASYVTAFNNGLYGIYAFFAEGGQIDHAYASGHPDSGIYIGQCKPCNAVVTDSVAERNAVGYEGTNSSGNLFIVNSVWRNNRVGITPNSQDQEKLAPQGDVVIAGNIVDDNDDPTAPSTAQGAHGYGIVIGGGTRDHVMRNLVRNNSVAGIAITDLNGYQPVGNEVTDNVLRGNGVDLAYFSSAGSVGGAGAAAAAVLRSRSNCFAGNTFASSMPRDIQKVLGCPGKADASLSASFALQPGAPNVDYRTVKAPPAQPEMPDAAGAPARSATGLSPVVDLAAITVPSAGG